MATYTVKAGDSAAAIFQKYRSQYQGLYEEFVKYVGRVKPGESVPLPTRQQLSQAAVQPRARPRARPGGGFVPTVAETPVPEVGIPEGLGPTSLGQTAAPFTSAGSRRRVDEAPEIRPLVPTAGHPGGFGAPGAGLTGPSIGQFRVQQFLARPGLTTGNVAPATGGGRGPRRVDNTLSLGPANLAGSAVARWMAGLTASSPAGTLAGSGVGRWLSGVGGLPGAQSVLGGSPVTPPPPPPPGTIQAPTGGHPGGFGAPGAGRAGTVQPRSAESRNAEAARWTAQAIAYRKPPTTMTPRLQATLGLSDADMVTMGYSPNPNGYWDLQQFGQPGGGFGGGGRRRYGGGGGGRERAGTGFATGMYQWRIG